MREILVLKFVPLFAGIPGSVVSKHLDIADINGRLPLQVSVLVIVSEAPSFMRVGVSPG